VGIMEHNSNSQSPAKIIIADDDPSIVLLLKHVLLTEGYSITEAKTGNEVIEYCKETDFDLAIVDIVMPEMNGIDACRFMKTQLEESPPVLMITSLDDDVSIDQAFDAGAVDYITKPINWSVFKNRVRRLIDAEKTRQTVKKLEYHDHLIGLPNRILLMDRLESSTYRAKRNGSHAALIMIDIDNFKLINETLGHDNGDMLLQSVAKRLQDDLRETDTLSRTDGNEFSIIIENISHAEDTVLIAKNLSKLLEHTVTLADQSIHIKASIGIALYPQDGKDIGTLLRSADIALHRAKERGQNLYQFFSPDLSKRAVRRLSLENSLRQAIENNELVVYYQPKVNLETNKPQGMEALVRWQHPEQGLIPPDEFIPIAEETGLIVQLGEWVIRTACSTFSQWKKDNLPIDNISINVSARQFKEQDLVSLFKEVLQQTGLDANYVELELTESALLNREDHAESKLNQLHNMGLKISIDDFGTGYASLSYLKRLPIDILKIDRSFTDGILSDPDDIAIINAITGLAQAMDLKLVAEGIETIEQLEKIRGLKIDYGQGYYWSPPCSDEDYKDLLARLNPED
jgi:diguanylate cyclase (GGDEF)-like protein